MRKNLIRSINNLLRRHLSSALILFKIMRKNVGGFIGFVIVLLFALMAIIGPVMVPLDLTIYPSERYALPSLNHPLGTDYGGRDTLTLIVHGSRDVIFVAVLTALITCTIGVTLGVASGFMGGKVDAALMTAVDIFLTIPGFPLLLVVVGLTRDLIARAPFLMAFVLSVTAWAGLARSIRSQVLSFKEKEFIEAAKTLGLGTTHILLSEVIPNLMPYIAMNIIIGMTGAIYAQVGLYFLGILPSTPTNWGVMLNLVSNQLLGLIYSKGGIYYIMTPIMCILLLQLGLVLLTEATDEIFNPRLREE